MERQERPRKKRLTIANGRCNGSMSYIALINIFYFVGGQTVFAL